jgi:hypothetical protein
MIQNLITTFRLCEEALEPVLSIGDALPIVHTASAASRLFLGLTGTALVAASRINTIALKTLSSLSAEEEQAIATKEKKLLYNAAGNFILGASIGSDGGFLIGMGRAAYHNWDMLRALIVQRA